MASETAIQYSMASRRLIAAIGCALSVAAWQVSASAELSEAQKEVARAMMEEGDEAYDAGRYAHALESYRGADAIVGVPTTGLAVAFALEKMGKLREARETALRVATSKPVVGEPKMLADARVRATALALELEAAIPTLHIAVTHGPQAQRVTLAIDRTAVPSGVSAPVPLDPGDHEYRLTAEGFRPVEGRVSLARNERRRIEHVLTPVSPGVKAPANHSTPALVYLGFGLGAAGVLVGTTAGIVSLSKASKAKDQCDGTECWPEARSDADSAKRYATLSNVSFGIGLAGVGIGLAALLMPSTKGSPEPGRVRLEVAPVHAGAGIRLVRDL